MSLQDSNTLNCVTCTYIKYYLSFYNIKLLSFTVNVIVHEPRCSWMIVKLIITHHINWYLHITCLFYNQCTTHLSMMFNVDQTLINRSTTVNIDQHRLTSVKIGQHRSTIINKNTPCIIINVYLFYYLYIKMGESVLDWHYEYK